VEGAGWSLERVAEVVERRLRGHQRHLRDRRGEVPLAGWRLLAGDGAGQPVVLRYRGVIRHELSTSGEEYQRSFSETPGSNRSGWGVPRRHQLLAAAFGEQLVTFSLESAA